MKMEMGGMSLRDRHSDKKKMETSKMLKVGDRVKVKSGKDHDEMTKDKEGTIEETGTMALGVKFKGSNKVHKWYVADELEAIGDE